MRAVVESYLALFGVKRFLRALASPIFFDALAASSYLDELEGGATTVLAIALKNFLRPETGLAVVGGKRRQRFMVPEELEGVAESFGFDEEVLERLKYASRMVAKVDDVAIQDGYPLYFHLMVVSSDGEWSIIQQGVKGMTGLVRRYHWSSSGLVSFVVEPHSGIISSSRMETVLDMTDGKSEEARRSCVELVNTDLRRLRRLYLSRAPKSQLTLKDFSGDREKEVKLEIPKIKWSTIKALGREGVKDFEELLAYRGVGAQTLSFLVIAVIELYGVYPSFEDPAILFEEAYKSPNAFEDRWLYEVMDAVKEAAMPMAQRRRSLGRISALFQLIDS